MEQRREDTPCLDQLRRGDGEGLVATCGVEQHPLVRVTRHERRAVAKLRRVAQPHRHRRAPLTAPGEPGRDAGLLSDGDGVQGLIGLHAHD